MESTTTNYAEAIKITNLVKELNITDNILAYPRTMEGGVTTCEKIVLDPNACGPAVAIFKEIDVEIHWKTWTNEKTIDFDCGIEPRRLTVLTIEFNYTHHGGGRNGRRVEWCIEGNNEIKLRD